MEALKPEIVAALDGAISVRRNLRAQRRAGAPRRRAQRFGWRSRRGGAARADDHRRRTATNFWSTFAAGKRPGFSSTSATIARFSPELRRDRTVLNCFAYTGGFSVYAFAAGAKAVVTFDSSHPALQIAEKNLTSQRHRRITTGSDQRRCLRLSERDRPDIRRHRFGPAFSGTQAQ